MSADMRGNATAGASGDLLTPGEHLRTEIERLGLDQVAVSQATGVSRQTINNIVNGRQPISRAMAGKLARLTGHSSDYWLHASFPRARAARKLAKSGREGAWPLGVGVLVNHQIVRAVKAGVIEIDPFDEANVRPASIDLTLDDFVITGAGDKVDISGGQTFVLRSGQTVNISTRERIALPHDYIGRAGAVIDLASLGVMTSQGFQIEPGFNGHLRFCVFNAGNNDVTLRAGKPIVSLELMPLSATPARVGAVSSRR
jgi:deoxycytidine triphosphate deaminase/addiction module HigA family antidote